MAMVLLIIAFLLAFSVPAVAQDTIRFGTYGNYPPWTISDPHGELSGFEIDLMNDLCRRMNTKCDIKAVNFARVFDDLDANAYDVYLGGMTANTTRMKRVTFSRPYAAASTALMALATSDLNSAMPFLQIDLDSMDRASTDNFNELLQRLHGKKIAVHINTIHEEFIKKYLRGEVVPIVYTDEESMYYDLLKGKIDIVMATSYSLKAYPVDSGSPTCSM